MYRLGLVLILVAVATIAGWRLLDRTVTAADVQELSLRRANSVKQALIRKFPSLQPNQFTTVGKGWDRPADPGDPNNSAKNRRVEIKVYPLESK